MVEFIHKSLNSLSLPDTTFGMADSGFSHDLDRVFALSDVGGGSTLVSRRPSSLFLGWPEEQEFQVLLVLDAIKNSKLNATHRVKSSEAQFKYLELSIDDCVFEKMTISYCPNRRQSIRATLGNIESNSDSVISSLLKFPLFSMVMKRQLESNCFS